MKIWFVSQSFYPYIGGVSTFLLNMEMKLAGMGHRIKTVHLAPPGAEAQDKIRGIHVIRARYDTLPREVRAGYLEFKTYLQNLVLGIGTGSRPLRLHPQYRHFLTVNKLLARRLQQCIDADGAGVIHVHDFQCLAVAKYLQTDAPVLYSHHTGNFAFKWSPVLLDFFREHLSHYDVLVFISDVDKNNAVQMGFNHARMTAIPPCINTSLFSPGKPEGGFMEKHGISNKKIILSVQRIDNRSGHKQLIKSMPAIIRRFPDAHLTFIGRSSLTNFLQNGNPYMRDVTGIIEKLDLSNRVSFLGNVDYFALPDYYRACRLYCNLASVEALGLSSLEAMSCGKPVIANDIRGSREVVMNEKTGYLVSVDDTGMTADKIVELMGNTTLSDEFGSAGKKLANKFSVRKIVDDHLELYHSLQ